MTAVPPPPATPARPSTALGTFSLCAGIAALLLVFLVGLFNPITPLASIGAVVLGIVSLSRREPATARAVVGLVVGAGFVLWTVMVLAAYS